MHINWSGLGEVFLIALVAGVGLVTLFSLGITALGRRADRTQPAGAATAVAGFSFLACAALLAYGLYLVIAK